MRLGAELLETLDRRDADPALVRRTLQDIARVNARLGGRAAVVFGLRRLLRDLPRGFPVTILDVGAGGGDMIARLAPELGGREVRFLAVEPHPVAAKVCAASGAVTLRADGVRLPLRSAAVDVAVASQVLHHLDRGAVPEFVRELSRVVRVGVVVADLVRSSFAAFCFPVVSRLMRLHPVTEADGVISLNRGFTRGELADLLRRAGVEARVYRRPGFRLVACWRKGGGNSG
jgi:SAM-dependent methyltransferase